VTLVTKILAGIGAIAAAVLLFFGLRKRNTTLADSAADLAARHVDAVTDKVDREVEAARGRAWAELDSADREFEEHVNEHPGDDRADYLRTTDGD